MLGSECNLKMCVWNLGFPTNRGSKTTFSRRLRNLAATLTALFGIKNNIHNWGIALTTTRGLLHRLKMSWTLVHKRLKIGPQFLPNLRKFCFLLHCRTGLANGTQPNFAKLWIINRANISWSTSYWWGCSAIFCAYGSKISCA